MWETAAKFDGRPFTIKIAAGNWYPFRVKTGVRVSTASLRLLGHPNFPCRIWWREAGNPASPLCRLAAVVNSVLLKFVLEEARPLPTQRWSKCQRWLFRSFLSDATPTQPNANTSENSSWDAGANRAVFLATETGFFRRSLARGSATLVPVGAVACSAVAMRLACPFRKRRKVS